MGGRLRGGLCEERGWHLKAKGRGGLGGWQFSCH